MGKGGKEEGRNLISDIQKSIKKYAKSQSGFLVVPIVKYNQIKENRVKCYEMPVPSRGNSHGHFCL